MTTKTLTGAELRRKQTALKDKIEELEADNEHTLVMLAVARYLNAEHYIKVFTNINNIINTDNYMHYCIKDYREYKWQNLRKAYENELLFLYPDGYEVIEELPF